MIKKALLFLLPTGWAWVRKFSGGRWFLVHVGDPVNANVWMRVDPGTSESHREPLWRGVLKVETW